MASRPRMAYEVDVSRLDMVLPLGVVVAQGRDSRLSRNLGWRARSAAWTRPWRRRFLGRTAAWQGAADVRQSKAAVGGPAWGEQDLRPLLPAVAPTDDVKETSRSEPRGSASGASLPSVEDGRSSLLPRGGWLGGCRSPGSRERSRPTGNRSAPAHPHSTGTARASGPALRASGRSRRCSVDDRHIDPHVDDVLSTVVDECCAGSQRGAVAAAHHGLEEAPPGLLDEEEPCRAARTAQDLAQSCGCWSFRIPIEHRERGPLPQLATGEARPGVWRTLVMQLAHINRPVPQPPVLRRTLHCAPVWSPAPARRCSAWCWTSVTGAPGT